MDTQKSKRISLNEIATRVDYWNKIDQFMLDRIDFLVTKLEEVNQKLGDSVTAISARGAGTDAAKVAVGEIFRSGIAQGDLDKANELVKSLRNNQTIEPHLRTLAGLVHYSALMTQRFSSFRTVLQVLDVLYMGVQDPERNREMLLRYGPELQHLWKYGYVSCPTVAERDYFKQAIGKV